LKYEIKKAIYDVPDDFLENLLVNINQIKKLPKGRIDLSHHLGLIIRDDKELLKRLAQ